METISQINLDDLLQIYSKFDLIFSGLHIEKESIEYDASRFKLNQKLIIYRTAKITPTKIGQFVTIWKRNEQGFTTPFDSNDDFDFMIINCAYGNLTGQFIFPKSVLLDQKIISGNNSTGKRGMRVYPPWSITTNKQAQRTQQWQLNFFLAISTKTDLAFAKRLLK